MAALAGGGDTCGARRGKTEKGEGRLTGGARAGFLFSFLFFFLGCDTYDPVCESIIRATIYRQTTFTVFGWRLVPPALQ